MCVIMIAETHRLTPDMVEKGFIANDAGAGIAWREGDEVVWEKGLALADVQEYAKEVPLPYVAHFRIPSCGGKSTELTHPFPITKEVSLSLSGRTTGAVLFHNGHWTDWKKDSKEAMIKSHTLAPSGKWSDSRAMALMAAIYGIGILEFIDEKSVAFSPTDIDVTTGAGWVKVGEVWCSNGHWQHAVKKNSSGFRQTGSGAGYYSDYCIYGPCRRKDINEDGLCPAHVAQGPLPEKKEVKELPPIKGVEGEKTTTIQVVNAGTQKDVSPLPFAMALKLWKEGRISKKEFKRARRAFEVLRKYQEEPAAIKH